MKLLILILFLVSCDNFIELSNDNCTEPVDCTGECGGSAVEDECGLCNGTGIADGSCDCDDNVEDACGFCGGNTNSADECPDVSCDSEICISIINVNNNSLDIGMINSVPVRGFQFDITGISGISASGGLAAENGLTISAGSATIIGFSFGGSQIPSNSNGILIHVTFTAITEDICLENVIFSDSAANHLDTGIINPAASVCDPDY